MAIFTQTAIVSEVTWLPTPQRSTPLHDPISRLPVDETSVSACGERNLHKGAKAFHSNWADGKITHGAITTIPPYPPPYPHILNIKKTRSVFTDQKANV